MNAMNAQTYPELTLYDFSTTTNTAAWQIVNDDVMGGLSTSRLRIADGVAVFQGEVSLDNNGGFASVRTWPVDFRLNSLDTLILRVRGDGRQYKFTARMDPGFNSPIYQTAFSTRRGEWQEHRFSRADFFPTFRGRLLAAEPALDLAKVTSVGFLISDKQAGHFRLEIAWIKAATVQTGGD